MNNIHEIYYVFFNSYRIKIKKTGTVNPGIFYLHISCLPLLTRRS